MYLVILVKIIPYPDGHKTRVWQARGCLGTKKAVSYAGLCGVKDEAVYILGGRRKQGESEVTGEELINSINSLMKEICNPEEKVFRKFLSIFHCITKEEIKIEYRFNQNCLLIGN